MARKASVRRSPPSRRCDEVSPHCCVRKGHTICKCSRVADNSLHFGSWQSARAPYCAIDPVCAMHLCPFEIAQAFVRSSVGIPELQITVIKCMNTAKFLSQQKIRTAQKRAAKRGAQYSPLTLAIASLHAPGQQQTKSKELLLKSPTCTCTCSRSLARLSLSRCSLRTMTRSLGSALADQTQSALLQLQLTHSTTITTDARSWLPAARAIARQAQQRVAHCAINSLSLDRSSRSAHVCTHAADSLSTTTATSPRSASSTQIDRSLDHSIASRSATHTAFVNQSATLARCGDCQRFYRVANNIVSPWALVSFVWSAAWSPMRQAAT